MKYAGTCLYKLWEHRVLSDKFIIDWADKNIRLDKESGLYDKKAEKKFRDETEKCVNYLRSLEFMEETDEEDEKEKAAE